ncbi:hypothetical protein ASF83_04630 [Plantibacter sp. Leaf171]|nr:hypothetical protein ASE44_04645 [Plantibacter sp. Leaf1]KQR58419.1 hypothetical protein ASF83_04630 [Plantibacter sp. Leaf171]
MVETESEFWGSQGRLGQIRKGELLNRHVFVYPDTAEPWWTVVVETTPDATVPDDRYIPDTDLFMSLMHDWEVAWLPRGQEEQDLEAELFGWRPLNDMPSWTSTSIQPARFRTS